MVSVCYLPTAGRLTLTIIKGRNFKAMDITGSSGIFSETKSCDAYLNPLNILLRSLRESVSGVPGKTHQEKENIGETIHTESRV